MVIFDVDHVVIMPTDKYDINLHPYRKELWQKLCGKISTNEIKLLTGIKLKNTKLVNKYDILDSNIFNHYNIQHFKNIFLGSEAPGVRT